MVININSSEQSGARLQLQPTPRCAGFASPDLYGRAPPHPTPRSRAPPRPTPRSRAPPRPTPRPQAPPRPTSGGGLRLACPRGHGLRLARPLGCGLHLAHWGSIPPPTTPGLGVSVWVKTLTPRKRLARLDVTGGHDGPYLRIHIKNSVGRTGAVLPNPRTNTDRCVSSPRCPSGQNGMP